ncbi:Hypothetical_protein [Hexamita inflata]|uniref:Hypothetical_protein n=1 Tax=Hexamita inflata TaxID=28002 RepID=A0AA86UY27_9EUKA|nr:Hypothetical protein HINF_LOCUS64230 [Hexamita inflata]
MSCPESAQILTNDQTISKFQANQIEPNYLTQNESNQQTDLSEEQNQPLINENGQIKQNEQKQNNELINEKQLTTVQRNENEIIVNSTKLINEIINEWESNKMDNNQFQRIKQNIIDQEANLVYTVLTNENINEKQIENNQIETTKLINELSNVMNENQNEQEQNIMKNKQFKTLWEKQTTNQTLNEQQQIQNALLTNQIQNQQENVTNETQFQQNNPINEQESNLTVTNQLDTTKQQEMDQVAIQIKKNENLLKIVPKDENQNFEQVTTNEIINEKVSNLFENKQIEISNENLNINLINLNEKEMNQTVEIAVKDFQQDKTAKVIKMLKKQFTQVMQASADEDNTCIYLTVLQSDSEYVMKTIKKMKIEDKKLTCAINTNVKQTTKKQNIIKQEEQPETNKKPLYYRRKATNKINTEEYANNSDNMEMCEVEVDLSQFSQEQTPKLLKTLNKKLENILSTTILENGNISVKLYKIYKKETINMIQRFKIGETKLVCIKQSKSKLSIMQTASMLNESLQEQECNDQQAIINNESIQEIITDIINSCIVHAILGTQADK